MSAFAVRRMVILGIALILIIVAVLFGIVIATFRTLQWDMVEAETQTEPVVQNYREIYNGNGIRLLLDWDGGPITGPLAAYVYNDTDEDLHIYASGVCVNGVMTEDVSFFCEAEAHEGAESMFWIHPEDLEELGFSGIETVEYVLEIITEDYDVVATSPQLSFGPGGDSRLPQQEGEEVYHAYGLRLLYQGVREDEIGMEYLRFYCENTNPYRVRLLSDIVRLNGDPTDLSYWQILFPNTCGFSRIYLEDDLDMPLGELEMQLWVVPEESEEKDVLTEPISVSLR